MMELSDKSPLTENESEIEASWFKYSLSIVLFILSLLCLFALLHQHVEGEKTRLERLDLVHQQYAMTFKIALLVNSTDVLSKPENRTDLVKKLNLALNSFEKTHLALISGRMPSGREINLSSDVASIYFSTQNLDGNSRGYINQVKKALTLIENKTISGDLALKSLILSSSYILAENLTEVSNIFARENEKNLRIFYVFEILCLIIILMTLLINSFFVVRPLVNRFTKKNREFSEKTKIQTELSHRRRQFISGIIPVIQQPLSHLKQSVSDIKRTELSPIAASKIHIIDASVQNVERLAALMIEYVSLEVDGIAATLSRIRLETLGKEIINSKIKEANLIGITLNLEFPDAQEWFLLKAASIRSILSHLLDNALKNTPKGGVVTLKITYNNLPNSTDHKEIFFAVSDTGTGIDQNVRRQMFDMFTRGSVHRDKNNGAGLGLAIVSQIAKNLNADINVQSKQNKGSSFTLVLKAKKATKDKSVDLVPNSYYCLLAEDNIISQQFYEDILRDMGHSVLIVDNGAKAVEAARTTRFDIIIMDMVMPVMNGLEAAQKIKEEHKNCPPIIAISSQFADDDIGSFREKGIDASIAKPADKNDIQKIINDLVSKDINS